MSEIKNILAQRYASTQIKEIFSEEGKILYEREFWIAVLKAQKELGIDIPQEAIIAYEKEKNNIDLNNIATKEKVLRHDVKARIESYCELTKYQHIHKGMTSRDLTDNVEQYQILQALKIIQLKTIRVLELFATRAKEFAHLVITGRTHNVPAQPTTLGKRLAMFGEEIILALENVSFIIEHYPLRGLKGAIGTLLDQKTLFMGNEQKIYQLEKAIAQHLGFKRILNATGQVYPRSLDFQVISGLVQLAAGASSFSTTLRLMAGQGFVSEGFKKGQVGSSAMPHKINPRNCERINGFMVILKGHLSMISGLVGTQWNEGDVSCSVVRRVVLPDAFFTIDGLLETLMTVLLEMQVMLPSIKQEIEQNLPFLATTTILMEVVKKGIGREEAHEIIKKYATETIHEMQEGIIKEKNFLEKLAADKSFPLTLEELETIISNPTNFTGMAENQVVVFCSQVDKWLDQFPEAKNIKPGRIL